MPGLIVETRGRPARGFQKSQQFFALDGPPIFKSSRAPAPPHQLVDRKVRLRRLLGIDRFAVWGCRREDVTNLDSDVAKVTDHMIDVIIEYESQRHRFGTADAERVRPRGMGRGFRGSEKLRVSGSP